MKKRCRCDSGSGKAPHCSRGFWVAITKKGINTGQKLGSAGTVQVSARPFASWKKGAEGRRPGIAVHDCA